MQPAVARACVCVWERERLNATVLPLNFICHHVCYSSYCSSILAVIVEHEGVKSRLIGSIYSDLEKHGLICGFHAMQSK